MDDAVSLVRNMKQNLGQGVLLSSQPKIEVTAYYDADWASCPFLRRSVTSYFVKLGESMVY